MENFLIVLIYFLIGIFLKKLSVFGKETSVILNQFVIYISLPALILLKLHTLSFSSDIFIPAATAWGILFVTFFAILFLSKIFKWDRKITGCLLLLIPLGNTSFLGIPIVEAFFGKDAVLFALIYDQLGSFLALATYGTLIIAFYGSEEKKPNVKIILKRIAVFPPFLALLAAIALKPIAYPQILEKALEGLSLTLIPLVMIAVGFQLSLKMDKREISPLTVGLTIKLAAAPLAVLLLFKLLGISGEAADVAVLEAGMPPMVSAGAIAIISGLSPNLSATLVGFGLILSFLTLPLLYYIL